MAFCPNCGTQMADNSAFCPSCGKATSQAGVTGAPVPPVTTPATGYTNAPPVAPTTGYDATAPAAPMPENIAGMLAYVTIIPAIVFLLVEPYNRNRFVRFHSFQCLFTAGALIVLHVALTMVGYALPLMVFPIWGLLGLAELALWLLLVIKAYQHQIFKLPVVGDMAEKQAGA